MGQKVNPISNRLGIIRGWDSNWYGGKNYYVYMPWISETFKRDYLDNAENRNAILRYN